jgi:uncharacterized damage-inducible protein DinB
MKRSIAFLVLGVFTSLPAYAQMAQTAGANPLAGSLKGMYDGIKKNLSESAEKMPEANYSFKPTPDVRSFGEIIGHVANSNFFFCSRVKGEKNPNDGNDLEKKTAKADLVKGLQDAIAYCDGAYGSATDATAMEIVKTCEPPNQREVPRAQFLIGNIAHNNEHYGNIVTYLRLKGIVPPSTERAQQMRRPSAQ